MPIIAQRWRKAVVTSLLFHVLALTVVGYSAVRLFSAPQVVEQFIELDLASTVPVTDPANNILESPSVPVAAPETSQAAPVMEHLNPTPVVTSADPVSQPISHVEVPDVGNVSGSISAIPGSSGAVGKGNAERSGIIPPRILSKVEPEYSSAARQAEMQGTVILKVQILENGRPGTISVVRSSGHELLDNAATTAVQRWRFVPAKDPESGRATICYSTLPVSFRLH